MLLRSLLFDGRNLCRRPNLISKRTFFEGWIAKVDNSAAVKYTMSELIELRQTLNLPWWCEIALVTVTFRALITFPLAVNQKKIFQRYEDLQPEIQAIDKKLRSKMKEEQFLFGRTKQSSLVAYRKDLTKEMNRLIVRDNCHPFKAGILPLFQIPLWFVLSHSYRNLARLQPNPTDPLAQLAYQQLQTEGMLWFTNLTIPDPVAVLPIMAAIINIINIQIYANERKRNGVKDTFAVKAIMNFGRLISFALIPIGLSQPAGMTFYWAISASWGLAQNLSFQNAQVKRILGLKDRTVVKKVE